MHRDSLKQREINIMILKSILMPIYQEMNARYPAEPNINLHCSWAITQDIIIKV